LKSLTAPDITADSLTLNDTTNQLVLDQLTITAPSTSTNTLTLPNYTGYLLANNLYGIPQYFIFTGLAQSIASTTTLALVDATGGTILLGLPSIASSSYDMRISVKKTTSSVNIVQVAPSGTERIDLVAGPTTRDISNAYGSITFMSYKPALSWFIVSQF